MNIFRFNSSFSFFSSWVYWALRTIPFYKKNLHPLLSNARFLQLDPPPKRFTSVCITYSHRIRGLSKGVFPIWFCPITARISEFWFLQPCPAHRSLPLLIISNISESRNSVSSSVFFLLLYSPVILSLNEP